MPDEEDLRATWSQFFRARREDAVRELVEAYPDERSLQVDLLDLYGFDETFAQALLADPRRYLGAGADALRGLDDSFERVHVRITNNPGLVSLDSVRSRHVAELVTVEAVAGTIDRVQSVPATAIYRCEHCGNRLRRRSNDRVAAPRRCPECGVEGTFTLDVGRSHFVDVQRVGLELPPEDRAEDAPPGTIHAVLDDDLVGTVRPDDRLLVTGIVGVSREPGTERFDFTLDVVSVEAARGRTADAADVPSALKRSIHERWERTLDR